MQATVNSKRFPVSQALMATIAGALLIVLLGVIARDIMADDGVDVSAMSGGLSGPEQIAFSEENTQLPDGATRPAAPVMDRADMLFVQENLQLPGDVGRPIQSGELRFYEENTQLPTSRADVALLAPEYRTRTGEVNF